MQHTYLRYECADAFGLTTSSASSKAPHSNSILQVVSKELLLTTAASQVILWNIKQALPVLKIGHCEPSAIGTGRALNSNQVVCLTVSTNESTTSSIKVATGWIDGTVRIFDVTQENLRDKAGLVHSLIQETDNEFLSREPLLLSGHSHTPVRSLVFDSQDAARLASGASDGSLVVWDVISETGLFRLLGHKGAITDISFVSLPELDGLVSSSLDGLVKVWDLQGQCCTQTIANHRGEVWGMACCKLQQEERWRMLTGSTDGQVRVWSVNAPKRKNQDKDEIIKAESAAEKDHILAVIPTTETTNTPNKDDDVCHYMGSLLPPPSTVTKEKVLSIHYHPNGRHVAILHANSKMVDVYIIKSAEEASRKQKRRLRRRREKQSIKSKSSTPATKGKKRGILDDPESSEDEDTTTIDQQSQVDPEAIMASDEFEFHGTVRASHKIKGFTFLPSKKLQVACALSTNAVEVYALIKKKENDKSSIVVSERVSSMDMYGHATGIRSIALSSDDVLACTVSKNNTKIWNVANRSCILSVNPGNKNTSSYGLCATFLPGNTHAVLGTREGRLLIMDIFTGNLVYTEEHAHEGAIWSIDLRQSSPQQKETIAIVTGSADKTVKFWDIEAQEEVDSDDQGDSGATTAGHPMVVHTRTLQMSDDVVAVRYSHSADPSKRMVFVSTLDCTIKVFFDDTLKFFLSLYGHKLPALAVDASDDDVILASSGADKTIKIWGLDFGDTHRTLYGHGDSITDLKFIRKTHNFFTTSKDGTVRYWDGDRFEQILLLTGHCAEVNCLAVSRTGAFVLSGSMDRQVRVWERTKDIVFLEEERERELEQMFDKVDSGMGDGGSTANLLRKRKNDQDEEEDQDDREEQPQTEAAVKRSVLSVSSGDRIMEALERADQEMKDIAAFRRSQGNSGKERSPNPFLLGLEPAQYVLWVLRSVKSADLEQSLLVLPLSHMERLVYYLIVLLKSGRGTEICSKVAVFVIKVHHNQIVSSRSLATPLRELRRLVRLRLGESRDTIGFNLAALRAIAKVTQDRKSAFFVPDEPLGATDIWAGLGLGSDVAAALDGKKK